MEANRSASRAKVRCASSGDVLRFRASTQARKLGEAIDHIEGWHKDLDKWYEMGGQTISKEEQCVMLLRMLPEHTPSWLAQTLEDYFEYEPTNAKLAKLRRTRLQIAQSAVSARIASTLI